MNHVLFGAAVPFLIAVILYTVRGGRASLPMLVAMPLFMTLGALWAVAPDIPRALGMHEIYLRIHQDPRINIFLWHYTIDQIEVDSRWYAVGIAVMAACLILAALREQRRIGRT